MRGHHRPFHLALPVRDLEATRRFYVDVLGCTEGRSAERWVDFDLFGHQLSAHLVDDLATDRRVNPVDGDSVPIPHFGVVLSFDEFESLARRIERANVPFVLGPRIRFQGEVGEQGTFFIRDPSGNALEFKALHDQSRLFSRE